MSVVTKPPYLKIACLHGIEDNKGVIWESENTFSEIYIAMHPVLIVMSATFDYFVYFSIPYRLNRIKKSPQEIELERIQLLKAEQKRKKRKRKPKQKEQPGQVGSEMQRLSIGQSEQLLEKAKVEDIVRITECSRESSNETLRESRRLTIKSEDIDTSLPTSLSRDAAI